MSRPTEHSVAGNDNPVTDPEEDRYGFTELAEKLSDSIIRLDRSISTVIGIEGRWGAGKTSLLNLLLKRMTEKSPEGTHVLQISPWLMPSGDSAAEALLLPVAAILDEKAAKEHTGLRRLWHKWQKAKASPLAVSVLDYTQQVSGRLAPLAELAGNFLPGAGIAASALKTVSAADLSARRQTTAALRNDIEQKIASLNLSFIVVIDDLDRLEPAQAVEVLRLIRSVADFSGFHYILCYDPEVLGHAVEQGLHVADGRHYLQKIIPISFNLPRPESFDLRRDFMDGAVALYTEVHGTEPDITLQLDLREVVASFGATLGTPREVSQVLGSLAFRYEGLSEYVWFPDLCLLQLLRVTLPGLYDWTEHYLTEYAVMASGEGNISAKEKGEMEQRLREVLATLPAISPLSVIKLRRWLPGIAGVNADTPFLFTRISELEENEYDSARRLGSSLYWRYYFAFSPSRDILPLAFFEHLFRLAADPEQGSALATHLLSQITDNGFSRQTRFEHILDRLNAAMIKRTTPAQCRGLLGFILEYGNDISERYRARGEWLTMGDLSLREVADRLLRHLLDNSRHEALAYLRESLTNEKRFHWSVSYLRHLLWQNGLAGNRPAYEGDRVFNDSELIQLRDVASAWLGSSESRELFADLNDLSNLVFAWRDISGPEQVSTWLRDVTQDDRGFLQTLLRLRYDGISSVTGFYQALRLHDIAGFLGDVRAISDRLDTIESTGQFPELINEVRTALALSRR